MPLSLGPGATKENEVDFHNTLNYLRRDPEAADIIDNSHYTVWLNTNNETSVYFPPDGLTNPIVNWDPTSALQVLNMDLLGVQSPAMGLLHELVHALFGANEAQATEIETRIAIRLDEPTRSDYNNSLDTIQVDNPTQHTDKDGTWTTVTADGQEHKGEQYDGTTTAPSMGGSAPSGGGGGGSGGTGGGGIFLPGTVSDDPDPGGSVEVQPLSGETPFEPLDFDDMGFSEVGVDNPYDVEVGEPVLDIVSNHVHITIVGIAELQ